MATPTKTVYENYCRICSSKKVTSQLSVIVTKSGEKTDTGNKLQNYCGLFITPNGSIRVKRMLSYDNTRGSVRARLDFPEQVSCNS